MSNVTSASANAHSQKRGLHQEGRSWVLFHEEVCPDPSCGSTDIAQDEVETTDHVIEVALICQACGTAWPVACVVDWENQPVNAGRP